MSEETKQPKEQPEEQPKQQPKEASNEQPKEKLQEQPQTKEEKPAAEEKPKEEKPKEEKPPAEQKTKKINRLTLKELEKTIQQVKEKMGNLTSAYARQLLSRKEQLLAETAAGIAKPQDQELNTGSPTESGGDDAAEETV